MIDIKNRSPNQMLGPSPRSDVPAKSAMSPASLAGCTGPPTPRVYLVARNLGTPRSSHKNQNQDIIESLNGRHALLGEGKTPSLSKIPPAHAGQASASKKKKS